MFTHKLLFKLTDPIVQKHSKYPCSSNKFKQPELVNASEKLGSSMNSLMSMGSYIITEPPLYAFFFMAISLYNQVAFLKM